MFSVGTFGINAICDLKFMKKYMESIVEMVQLAINRLVKFWLQSDLIYRLVGLKRKEDKLLEVLHSMSSTVSVR